VSRLRSLRVQVSIALVLAAAACAAVASKSSSDELEGAYRDSARSLLDASTTTLKSRLAPASLERPAELRAALSRLSGAHPELTAVRVYTANDVHGVRNGEASRPDHPSATVSVGEPAGGATELRLVREALSSGSKASAATESDGLRRELLVTPLERDGRVEAVIAAGYDLDPADEALAERNRRVLIVLGLLLTAFAVFALLVLERGIFRPLFGLRAAARAVGGGDLATRLGWRRQDELGDLARDFDAMATGLEERGRRLEELAHRDPLTGLSNHRRFQEALSREVELARRAGNPLAVVLLDIDDFKRLNEDHGHPFGDELLRAAGVSLRAALADPPILARVGGDEFGLVLPNVDGARALMLAEAARLAIETAGPVRGTLRCSAGVACFPEDARAAGPLLQLADGALSWAKAGGGGSTRPYEAEHVFVVTDEQRENFAGLIGRSDALRPVFQPIVSLSTGEPVGYEALARFADKPGLPPSWWFAQAHRFGLGAALEADAVRLALAQPKRAPGAFLSVNLSPSALASPEVRETLPTNLEGIVIEITEGERVLDVGDLQRHLDPLRSRGARIAVDDAGEGYAGLQQVMRMRADFIKLDRALVADVHSDPAKIALIGSLVHFARSTGASICAEGIETLDELRVLIHLGVASGQGWVFARPGEAWPTVNPEAAQLCRDLHGEPGRIVALGSRRSA
jgi:diguanylate cyclase (GGDEF)-like protein